MRELFDARPHLHAQAAAEDERRDRLEELTRDLVRWVKDIEAEAAEVVHGLVYARSALDHDSDLGPIYAKLNDAERMLIGAWVRRLEGYLNMAIWVTQRLGREHRGFRGTVDNLEARLARVMEIQLDSALAWRAAARWRGRFKHVARAYLMAPADPHERAKVRRWDKDTVWIGMARDSHWRETMGSDTSLVPAPHGSALANPLGDEAIVPEVRAAMAELLAVLDLDEKADVLLVEQAARYRCLIRAADAYAELRYGGWFSDKVDKPTREHYLRLQEGYGKVMQRLGLGRTQRVDSAYKAQMAMRNAG